MLGYLSLSKCLPIKPCVCLDWVQYKQDLTSGVCVVRIHTECLHPACSLVLAYYTWELGSNGSTLNMLGLCVLVFSMFVICYIYGGLYISYICDPSH